VNLIGGSPKTLCALYNCFCNSSSKNSGCSLIYFVVSALGADITKPKVVRTLHKCWQESNFRWVFCSSN
jgi:hypothetical protein